MAKNNAFQGKTEESLTNIKETLIRIEDNMDTHSNRISNLEKWRWFLTGAIGALTAVNWPEIGRLLAFR